MLVKVSESENLSTPYKFILSLKNGKILTSSGYSSLHIRDSSNLKLVNKVLVEYNFNGIVEGAILSSNS